MAKLLWIIPFKLNDLPDGFSIPEGRVKPWGTSHAILVAKDMINEPFCVINADDFYGREAYVKIAQRLINTDPATTDWRFFDIDSGNVRDSSKRRYRYFR